MNRFVEYNDSKAGITGGKSAFSLVELLVVLVIIASLIVLAIPGIKAMQKSFDSTGTEGMISAALATARTLAMSHQQYAGVRFQKAGDPNNALKADQYMIFIIYDSDNDYGWVCGFVAVKGYKPMKLPENIGVIDKIIWRNRPSGTDCGSTCVENPLAEADLDNIVINKNITDTSTFSIVFSPAGKIVIEKLRCARKSSNDDIFNTKNDIEANPPTGMFLQDNNDEYGIGVEMSRREFYLYDRTKFKNLTTSSQRMIYLDSLKPMYVNPYTGELIK